MFSSKKTLIVLSTLTLPLLSGCATSVDACDPHKVNNALQSIACDASGAYEERQDNLKSDISDAMLVRERSRSEAIGELKLLERTLDKENEKAAAVKLSDVELQGIQLQYTQMQDNTEAYSQYKKEKELQKLRYETQIFALQMQGNAQKDIINELEVNVKALGLQLRQLHTDNAILQHMIEIKKREKHIEEKIRANS